MTTTLEGYHLLLSTAAGKPAWGTDATVAVEVSARDNSGLISRFRSVLTNYPGDQFEPPPHIHRHHGFEDQTCEYYWLRADGFERLSGTGNMRDCIYPTEIQLRLLERGGHRKDGWKAGTFFLISHELRGGRPALSLMRASHNLNHLLDFPNRTTVAIPERSVWDPASCDFLGLLCFVRTAPGRKSDGTDLWGQIEFDYRSDNGSKRARYLGTLPDHKGWNQHEAPYKWSCEQYFLSSDNLKLLDGQDVRNEFQHRGVTRMALRVAQKRGASDKDAWKPSDVFVFAAYKGPTGTRSFELVGGLAANQQAVDASASTPLPPEISLYLPHLHFINSPS